MQYTGILLQEMPNFFFKHHIFDLCQVCITKMKFLVLTFYYTIRVTLVCCSWRVAFTVDWKCVIYISNEDHHAIKVLIYTYLSHLYVVLNAECSCNLAKWTRYITFKYTCIQYYNFYRGRETDVRSLILCKWTHILYLLCKWTHISYSLHEYATTSPCLSIDFIVCSVNCVILVYKRF